MTSLAQPIYKPTLATFRSNYLAVSGDPNTLPWLSNGHWMARASLLVPPKPVGDNWDATIEAVRSASTARTDGSLYNDKGVVDWAPNLLTRTCNHHDFIESAAHCTEPIALSDVVINNPHSNTPDNHIRVYFNREQLVFIAEKYAKLFLYPTTLYVNPYDATLAAESPTLPVFFIAVMRPDGDFEGLHSAVWAMYSNRLPSPEEDKS